MVHLMSFVVISPPSPLDNEPQEQILSLIRHNNPAISPHLDNEPSEKILAGWRDVLVFREAPLHLDDA